ncbi:MAG: hypothetical protein QOE90_2408 [Thermoplasmata archaeon]|nr:hypothetical protein [Thermoplasmata archaeon]
MEIQSGHDLESDWDRELDATLRAWSTFLKDHAAQVDHAPGLLLLIRAQLHAARALLDAYMTRGDDPQRDTRAPWWQRREDHAPR